jgi:transmembrane sensor
METQSPTVDEIAAEAEEWLLKLNAAEPQSAAHREALAEWLTRSPAHIEALLTAARVWHALAVDNAGRWTSDALIAAARAAGESDNVVPLRGWGQPAVRAQPERRQPTGWRRLAAVAATLLLGAIGAWVFRGYWPSQNEIKTAVGEQRSVTLADGSVVFLNTDSELRVRWTARERHMDLLRGEARFQVTKNPARPFIVATQEATVRAVGTVFNVRTGEATTQVAVLEGRVEVNADGNANANANANEAKFPAAPTQSELLLAAGQRAAVIHGSIEVDVGPPIERVTAWTERRLVFRGDPLSVVVAEFNRYRLRALVVDDSGLAAVRINGVFALDDPDSLLTYLHDFESVRVTRDGDGREHLSRGAR